MLIDHIKYNNLINCISYLYKLGKESVWAFNYFGSWNNITQTSRSPGRPNSRSSEDHEMVKAFGHRLFPCVFDIKIIINIFSLVSGLLHSRGFNLHFQNNKIIIIIICI
jgi:hypothetical protein